MTLLTVRTTHSGLFPGFRDTGGQLCDALFIIQHSKEHLACLTGAGPKASFGG